MAPSKPWTRSPAYADLVATLEEMGLDADPDAKHGKAWPTDDPLTNLRFQRRWTQRMQHRCGIDPNSEPGKGRKPPAIQPHVKQARIKGHQAHYAAKDTLPNRVLAVLSTDPREAMAVGQVRETLGLPLGSEKGEQIRAALVKMHRRGQVERFELAGNPRIEFAYYRRAA